MRWLFKVFLYLLSAVLLVLVLTNMQIVLSTKNKLFLPGEESTLYPIAIVLGTSNRTSDGKTNQFFENRIKTAADLYQQGKISHIIVSGDNRSKYYNEPVLMRDALIKLEVPAEVITLDYAGLRTLDSIVRGKEIFGQEKFTIITQAFHGYRALFISHYYGIDAMVVAAPNPTDHSYLSVKLREYFARTKAWLDVYILKTSPQHLGEKEQLNNQPLKDNR